MTGMKLRSAALIVAAAAIVLATAVCSSAANARGGGGGAESMPVTNYIDMPSYHPLVRCPGGGKCLGKHARWHRASQHISGVTQR